MSRTACIIIANGIDELELGIIIDILNRADIEYFLVGLKNGEILTSRNVKIQVEKTVDDVLNDSFDVIVLPGGNIATRAISVSEKVRTILSTQCRNKKLIAASGTAPFILSANNICIGNSITSYPTLKENLGKVGFRYDNVSNVDHDKNLITCRGAATTFDFALKIVCILCGNDKALQISEDLLLRKNICQCNNFISEQ